MDWLLPEDPDGLAAYLRDPPGPDRPLLATGAAAPPPALRDAGDLPDVDVVSTASLSGIEELRTGDLTVTVGAGTRVDELLSALRGEGTWIPVPGVALGRSVGGMVAAAWPGALDESHGDVRRQLLACEMVTWDGRPARWGRGVMKNVAGYGLTRTVAGAMGRLGVVHRATLRLWPAPEADRRVRVLPPADADALALAARAAGGDLDARVRPDAVLWRGGQGAGRGGGELEVRLVGSADSVELRLGRLRGWAEEHGAKIGEDPPGGAPPAGTPRAAGERPLEVSAAWVAPGRGRFAAVARGVVTAAGEALVSARGHPLAGRIRVAWRREGGPGPSDTRDRPPGAGPAAAVLRAAGDAPVALERGSPDELAGVAERRPKPARRLEERVVAALRGRPRHWLSGYL